MAAVQANTWLSAVDIVAAKMDAKIKPTQKGPRVSMAIIGKPNSGSKSDDVKVTRLASPIMSMSRINGVCQTKNQIMACFLSLSVPSVITLETTCGWPATPSPPRKNAKTHSVTPSFKSGGNISVRFSF